MRWLVQRAALFVLGLFGVLMMLAAACGGDDVAPTFTRGPATAVPATAVPSVYDDEVGEASSASELHHYLRLGASQ